MKISRISWQLVWMSSSSVASTRVQGWGDEPCEPTVRLPDWSELVASYSRMKSAWGWVNGGQPILVCYIRKYVIILGGYSPWRPQPKYWGWCVAGIPGGVDASARVLKLARFLVVGSKWFKACVGAHNLQNRPWSYLFISSAIVIRHRR